MLWRQVNHCLLNILLTLLLAWRSLQSPIQFSFLLYQFSGLLRITPVEFICPSSFDDLNSQISINKTDELNSSVQCSMDKPVYSSQFYILDSMTSSTSHKPSEYSCHMQEKVWACQLVADNTLSWRILYCDVLDSVMSDTSELDDISTKTLMSCSSRTEFILDSSILKHIEATYHPFFPLIEEYILNIDNNLPYLSSVDGEVSYKINECPKIIHTSLHNPGEDSGNEFVSIAAKNINRGVNITVEYKDPSNLPRFLLTYNNVVLKVRLEILSSLFERNTDTIFIIGKGISELDTYILSTEQNSEVLCAHVDKINPLNEHSIMNTLLCKIGNKEWSHTFHKWTLIVKDSNNIEVKTIPINITLFETNLNKSSSIIIQDTYQDSSCIVMMVDRLILSSWIIRNKEVDLIECNFFMTQSTLGFIADINKIICPIPEQFQNVLISSRLEYSTEIKIDEYIHVTILESSINEASGQCRMLAFNIPLAFSSLNPKIIKEPALAIRVNFSLFV